MRSPLGQRVLCLVLGLAAFSPLVIAAGLEPSPKGVATHTQLGLPACGWMASMGKPCISCGMTTAFAHAANGSFVQSVVAQPMGWVLAVLAASTGFACLHAAMTGWRAERLLNAVMQPKTLWIVAGGLLAAWGYKWVAVG
jgi:hypothetical protein